MNCPVIILLGLLGLLWCCEASQEHDKKGHQDNHGHHSIEHKKVPKHSSNKNDEKLHKKEEMLGQDMMRINDAEFKLQSLVSPEFHQGSSAINRGKPYGGLEVNTLSPEQVDFVQATAQWPKFSNPQSEKKDISKTIYPENPVLFPNEPQRQRVSYENNNWLSMGSNSFKQMDGGSFDEPIGNMMSMGSNLVSMGNSIFQERPQQKNTMQFDIKPGYTTTADAPVDDKMSFADLGGLKVEAKIPFGSRNKNAMSALLNEGIMNRRGKPIGILGNILKASQEMPTGKASARSGLWTNASPFSRRHKLERSKPNKAIANVRNTSKAHKRKLKN